MAKNPDSTRKFLQNIRTTKSNSGIEAILSGTVAIGEIAVQIGLSDQEGSAKTQEIATETGLWVLAGDATNPTQAVKIPSEARVKELISGGAVAEVDKIEAAVGLQDDGTIVKDDNSVWGTETKYFNSASTVVNAVKELDTNLNALSGVVADCDYELAKNENKIVVSLAQVDGKISGTSENITSVKLDGYTVGGDDSGKVTSTDTLGAALGKLQGQINGMDKDADSVAGKVVTTVSEVDGKVSETKANVKDLQLGGYSKDTTATGAIAGTDTINTALSKLENTVAANKITNADKSIVVTEPTGTATTTDIKVNIKSGENVIKLGEDGIYTNLNVVKITEELPATVKERYELRDSDDVKIGASIDIAKDSHIVSITYITDSADTHYQNLQYVYIDASGATQTVYVDMSSLVLEAEFASGVGITNHVAHGVVDPTSEKDESNVAFLTVDGPGFKISGIKDAIDTKINKLDVTDDATVAGQYVAAIQEENGIVSVKERKNVSEAVLNNYAKGTDATNVAATDTLNQAISKLENQVDKAKAAATTKVVEGTDNDHLTITSATSTTDSSVTYTVTLTDVASKEDVDEIAGFVGLSGQEKERTYSHTSSNYLPSSNNTVKGDIETIDTILGKDETAGPDNSGNTVFSSENTVAKSISDIKKDIAAFKDKLNVVDDDKYIKTVLTKGDDGTFTIGVSALTQSVSAATSSTSKLVDSWDAKVNLVHEIVDNTDTTKANRFNVTKTEASDSNSGVVYDFTNLVVDCGTF